MVYQYQTKKKFKHQKTAFEAVLEESNLVQIPGLPSIYNDIRAKGIVNGYLVENKTTVEVRGFEPPDSWIASQSPYQTTPTAFSLYTSK
jgi:hypothetical protein